MSYPGMRYSGCTTCLGLGCVSCPPSPQPPPPVTTSVALPAGWVEKECPRTGRRYYQQGARVAWDLSQVPGMERSMGQGGGVGGAGGAGGGAGGGVAGASGPRHPLGQTWTCEECSTELSPHVSTCLCGTVRPPPAGVIRCDECNLTNPIHLCSRCMVTYYCSSECQQSAWRLHKKLCVPHVAQGGAARGAAGATSALAARGGGAAGGGGGGGGAG